LFQRVMIAELELFQYLINKSLFLSRQHRGPSVVVTRTMDTLDPNEPALTAAVNFVLAMQAKQTPTDQNNARLALGKPLLVDNPSQTLSLVQTSRKKSERANANRIQRLRKRSERKSELKPIASEELQRRLFEIWLDHYGERTRSPRELSEKVDLRGCLLSVKRSESMVLPHDKDISGLVIRESKDVVHISSTKEKRVFCVRKRGTVFECDGVEFLRVV